MDHTDSVSAADAPSTFRTVGRVEEEEEEEAFVEPTAKRIVVASNAVAVDVAKFIIFLILLLIAK